MIQGQNFQYENPEDFITVNDGDVFFRCNFSQSKLDTVLFAGKKNLIFITCNMENVKWDNSWKSDGMCFTAKSKKELKPVLENGKLVNRWEHVKNLGRHAQTNLVTKTKMKDLSRLITNKQLLKFGRGKVNDISRNYKANPKAEITIEDN